MHQADTKGKWWLVGAAWGGDPLVDRMAEPIPETKETDNTLLKLAKKQGMNTDVRRSVFVVLMSSDVCILTIFPYYIRLLFSRIMWMLVTGLHS